MKKAEAGKRWIPMFVSEWFVLPVFWTSKEEKITSWTLVEQTARDYEEFQEWTQQGKISSHDELLLNIDGFVKTFSEN